MNTRGEPPPFVQTSSFIFNNLNWEMGAFPPPGEICVQENFLMRKDGHVAGTVFFKLGTMVGAQRTLGTIARKSSAASVRYLKEMRDTQQYKELGVPWKEFCVKYAGIDHKTANLAIAHYEEFGEAYFNLGQLMHLQPSGYRLLAGHIEGNTLEHNGEKIAIEPDNAARLV